MESILTGLRAGVVVVDRDLNVTSWNSKAEDLWGLRGDETKGKSILGLDIGLPVGQLLDNRRASLAGRDDRPEVVLDAVNRRGKPVRVRVTTTPLLGSGQARQGAILLMEATEQ